MRNARFLVWTLFFVDRIGFYVLLFLFHHFLFDLQLSWLELVAVRYHIGSITIQGDRGVSYSKDIAF